MRLYFILLITIIFSSELQAAAPHDFNQSLFQYETNLRVTDTPANYTDDGGSFEKLADENSFQNLTLDFTLGTHWRNWFLNAGARMSYSQSDGTDESRTNSDLSDILLNAIYETRWKYVNLIPEFNLLIPLVSSDEDTDEVMTTEGVVKVRSGFWLIGELIGLQHYFYAGYEWRDGGLSHLAHIQAGSYWQSSEQKWRIGGEITGFESVSDDGLTDEPTRRTNVSARVNGGSLFFNAIEPSAYSGGLWVDYASSEQTRWNFSAGGAFNGSNSAAPLWVGLKLTWLVGGGWVPTEQRRKLEEFDVPEDDYDESLFTD